jgi:hypothetical protein
MHPGKIFAETWAAYLAMVSVLDTACCHVASAARMTRSTPTRKR